jgi:hypothetical protein
MPLLQCVLLYLYGIRNCVTSVEVRTGTSRYEKQYGEYMDKRLFDAYPRGSVVCYKMLLG